MCGEERLQGPAMALTWIMDQQGCMGRWAALCACVQRDVRRRAGWLVGWRWLVGAGWLQGVRRSVAGVPATLVAARVAQCSRCFSKRTKASRCKVRMCKESGAASDCKVRMIARLQGSRFRLQGSHVQGAVGGCVRLPGKLPLQAPDVPMLPCISALHSLQPSTHLLRDACNTHARHAKPCCQQYTAHQDTRRAALLHRMRCQRNTASRPKNTAAQKQSEAPLTRMKPCRSCNNGREGGRC
jgi:hypothetical protein